MVRYYQRRPQTAVTQAASAAAALPMRRVFLLSQLLSLLLLQPPPLQATAAAAPPAAPVLALKQGRVYGAVDSIGVHRFLGVPFAEPPVGALRWQPPKPRTWSGTRPAVEYSDSCAQSKNTFDDIAPGSEDCLYLNIYMPAAPSTAPRPCMIFFYGGSDETGSAMFPLYSGGNLVARTNDLVVVTVNYRLNAFGWLGGDALRGADNSTGNWGLQDQVSSSSRPHHRACLPLEIAPRCVWV